MYVSDNWRGTDAGKWFLADLAESGQGFDYGLELGGLGVGEMGGEEGEGLGGGPVGAQGDLADEGGLLRKVGGPGQFFDGNGGKDGCGTWGGERGLLDRGCDALGLEVGEVGLTWNLTHLEPPNLLPAASCAVLVFGGQSKQPAQSKKER